jgi:ComF family protein
VAAYLYVHPLTAVVRALKFGGADFLGGSLGRELASCCGGGSADVVTAVPLAWPRLLLRGYNQAEAVARPLAAALGLPYRRLLRRRSRRRQTSLDRDQRRRNVLGTFRPRPSLEPGATVLVVDDVMTTGATLGAAAAALRRAGAAAVVAAVVARTPQAGWGEPVTPPG